MASKGNATMADDTQSIPYELNYDPQGRVVLRRPDLEDAVDVRIRRSFPWSDPMRYVSIRSSEGKELVLIEDLADLDAAIRSFVEKELTRSSFIPTISRVDKISLAFGHMEWIVQTDRGPATFRVQEREDVRFLQDGRFRVKDADGTVYELPTVGSLDPHSQKELEVLV